MGNKKLRNREEIPQKYKWNIEAMYADHATWEKDIQEVLNAVEAFGAYQGRLTTDASTLAEALQAKDAIWQKLEKAFVYARMKQDEDNRNTKQQAMLDKVNMIIAKVSAAMSFFTPELLSASEDTILGYLQEEPKLATYEFLLRDLLREKQHVLSKEEENILAQLSEVTDAPDSIYTMLSNADMKFGTITDEDGDDVELTHGNYIKFMKSHNRDIRQAAFEKMYETYKGLLNTISTAYSFNVKNNVISARIRQYDSARAAALSSGNIPEEVYDNLIRVVHEYLPVLHKYVELRKKVLGVETLKMHDVYVPLVELPDTEISYEESLKIMQEGLAPLGNDYIQRVMEGVEAGWIDVYENEGKTSGAYSFGSYDSYPYILLNHTDTLQDVFTLVHEMGHSMHSSYTRETQPFVYGSHSIFTAEVASTVNESLLIEHLLAKETDPQMRKYLINLHIEEFRTTLFRQTMFAEFEHKAHKYVEEGGSLTSEWLCHEYEQLNKLYFGPAMDDDDYIKYEWARIPHFYRAFYVYQYATGYSAATAISKKILTEGETAKEAYRKFLTTGDSDYPVELLKIAGIDMSTTEPIILAMETFKNLVEELEELL